MPQSTARPEVFVEANPLSDRHLTGIGRYTARIALALAKTGPVRFFSADEELILPDRLDWSQDQDLGLWGRRVWRSRRRPLGQPPRGSLAIYGCLRPEERRFPFEVSILHDFTPQVVPYTHSEKTRRMFQGFYAKTLLASDAALSVSHSTKADAGWLCDFPQDRIAVCHSGPSICVERHLDAAPFPRRPNVGLVVSTVEPRKNADFLLEWFRQTSVLPDDTELWWAGRVGWLTSRRRLRQYERLEGRRVRFLGVVSDAQLCRLYRTAGWSIYPSLYEGFGFPVLDALRHGAPVLTSYNSALREFQGLPGITYFDPCDAATLDEAYLAHRGAGSVEIPSRELEARYDWDRVAETLLSLPARFAAADPSAADASRAA
jgi:glycosyltransferase involved in cell wall biosynthesis